MDLKLALFSCRNGRSLRRRRFWAFLAPLLGIGLWLGPHSVYAQGTNKNGRPACGATLISRAPHDVKNYNAARTAAQYQQMNARDLLNYEGVLGPEFVAAVRSLNPIDLFIDSGAGKGLAARQIGLLKGARVVMINPQDYSGLLDFISVMKAGDWLQELDRNDLQVLLDRKTFYPKAIVTSAGLEIDIKSLVFALKLIDGHSPSIIDFASGPKVLSVVEYKKLFRELLTKILKSDKLSTLKHKYEVGLTENILSRYQGQAKVITDVYGAFYYSPERLQILESIYDALIEGGTAFIYLGKGIELSTNSDDWTPPLSAVYGGDLVTPANGAPALSLIEWLTRRYPDILRLQRLPSSPDLILVVQRQDAHALKSLKQNLRLVKASYYQFGDDGFVVPKLEFEESASN